MGVIDISVAIHTRMVIYPRNPPVRIRPVGDFLSEITMGTHTGTHVDAPRHAWKEGSGVDQINLQKCVGPCRVLDMTHVKNGIHVADLRSLRIQQGERILVKTRNSKRGYKKFFSDFVYLDGDAATFLAKRGIALFGTDYLSVKQRGNPDNRPHTELLKKKIVIFEGLDLSKVKPGRYTFVGLPLKLTGLDGSPARAVLLQ